MWLLPYTIDPPWADWGLLPCVTHLSSAFTVGLSASAIGCFMSRQLGYSVSVFLFFYHLWQWDHYCFYLLSLSVTMCVCLSVASKPCKTQSENFKATWFVQKQIQVWRWVLQRGKSREGNRLTVSSHITQNFFVVACTNFILFSHNSHKVIKAQIHYSM